MFSRIFLWFNFGKCKKYTTFALGKMAEWSIAAVLKTVELRGSGGSNPSLSAAKDLFREFLFFIYIKVL